MVLALTAACERGDAKASNEAPAGPVPTVIVAEIPQRTVQVSAEFVARTEAVPTVEIRARISGVLERCGSAKAPRSSRARCCS